MSKCWTVNARKGIEDDRVKSGEWRVEMYQGEHKPERAG